jgi:NAD(P)-dependent dehydrogenase (short-subunit alcohol dehydrogenase family)
MQCDLENVDEIQKMFEWIENEPELGRVDVCVPNAGLSANTTLLDGKIDPTQADLVCPNP